MSHDGARVLLLHHRKLDRWLQPGGHADTGETAGEQVALREALEETGIRGLSLHPGAPRPLDVDVHEIPARAGEPAHDHLDLRYLVVAPAAAVVAPDLAELHAIRWVPWDETDCALARRGAAPRAGQGAALVAPQARGTRSKARREGGTMRQRDRALVRRSSSLSPRRPWRRSLTRRSPAALRPPDSLTLDGIPAIPAAIAEQVGRYAEFRSAAVLGWHPTRRELLISTRFADTPQVHELRMPGGARRQLTFFPDRVTQRELAAARVGLPRVRQGPRRRRVLAAAIAWTSRRGAITLISDGGRSQNGLGPWSHEGDRLAFGSTRRNGRDRDVFVMDPRDPATARAVLQVEGGGWAPSDWSPDDRQLAVVEEISVNESYLWLVDVASGEKRLVTPKGGPEKVSYGAARFAADGRGLYITTDRESEFQRLAYVDLATGRHTYLTPQIPWDVEDFALSPDGRTIAFATNEDGLSVVCTCSTRRAARSGPRRGCRPASIAGLDWSSDSRELAFSRPRPRSPSDVYSLDAAHAARSSAGPRARPAA